MSIDEIAGMEGPSLEGKKARGPSEDRGGKKQRTSDVDHAVFEFPVNEGSVNALDGGEVKCVLVRTTVTFNGDALPYKKTHEDMRELAEVGDLLEDKVELHDINHPLSGPDMRVLLVEPLPGGSWMRPFRLYRQADLALAAVSTLLEGMPSDADPAVDPFPLPKALVPPGWFGTLRL
jgi:hypothetical protein